jgi:hypothetical protein
MEAILTALYLVCLLGSGLLISYGLVSVWDAHKRGMERVREYDARQEARK